MRKIIELVLFVGVLVACQKIFAGNNQFRDPRGFVVHIENDFYFDTDGQYSNGLRFCWLTYGSSGFSSISKLPRWTASVMDRLLDVKSQRTVSVFSFSIGQGLYTPDDIRESELIPDDRPYAGLLCAGFGFYKGNGKIRKSLELDLGVVGPLSLAGTLQKGLHELRKWPMPGGWSHQLKNEPVLDVAFLVSRKYRLIDLTLMKMEVLPRLGGALGNALTGLNGGIEIRLGTRLPDDFGNYMIRPGSDPAACADIAKVKESRGLHLFCFGAIDGMLVLRNILLDGNTFVGSHRVEKEPWVGEVLLGAGLMFGQYQFVFSAVLRSKEFVTQKRRHAYISLSLFHAM